MQYNVPVSYTHLDVYKRQAQFSPMVPRPGPFLESLSQACWFMKAKSSSVFLVQYVWKVNGGKGPVSYTHLDVYKRQVLC